METLRKWISSRLGLEGGDDSPGEVDTNLAVAALFVEVLRADYETQESERHQVVESLGAQLGLAPDKCADLMQLARDRVEQANDLYQFTSVVNQGMSAEEKLRLVEQMWRIAGADAVIHKYEEHVIRRVAELLYVPHREFIAAKLRAGPGPR